MRITLTVEGLDQARANFTEFSDRRFAAGVATALTRTALGVRDDIKREMPAIFDRPTPYTLNSLFVRTATAQRLDAEVYFKDESATSRMGTPAAKFLMPHVDGSGRRIKRFERALQVSGNMPTGWHTVPGAYAKLDAYGNISTGQIIQILSQLRVTLTAGHTRNMAFGVKSIAAQRKAGGRYFVVMPGAKGAAPGVYQREFIGRRILPVLMFVRGTAYPTRFDFDRLATESTQRRLPAEFDRAMAEQLVRLRQKAA